MGDQPRITLRRLTSYPDRLRSYQVKLDGKTVGSVRAGESVTIAISPGKHSLSLKIDWCGSGQIEFEAQSNQHISFECGSNLTGLRVFLALFYIIFQRNRYLWLRIAA